MEAMSYPFSGVYAETFRYSVYKFVGEDSDGSLSESRELDVTSPDSALGSSLSDIAFSRL